MYLLFCFENRKLGRKPSKDPWPKVRLSIYLRPRSQVSNVSTFSWRNLESPTTSWNAVLLTRKCKCFWAQWREVEMTPSTASN